MLKEKLYTGKAAKGWGDAKQVYIAQWLGRPDKPQPRGGNFASIVTDNAKPCVGKRRGVEVSVEVFPPYAQEQEPSSPFFWGDPPGAAFVFIKRLIDQAPVLSSFPYADAWFPSKIFHLPQGSTFEEGVHLAQNWLRWSAASFVAYALRGKDRQVQAFARRLMKEFDAPQMVLLDQIMETTPQARSNPRAVYTVLYEHTSGKRGGTLGLPGTGELEFFREKDYTGRYEPKIRVIERVGRWLKLLSLQGNTRVMLLDAEGEEVSPIEFVEAYKAAQYAGRRF